MLLTLSSLSHAGEGIGRHAGQAVFVPGGLPGETVRVEVTARRKNFLRARLLEVIQAAPERVQPPCPHALRPGTEPAPGWCGGCQLQHLAYPAQLRFKQEIVVEQLRRIGRFDAPPVLPVLTASEPFGYRNHAQFSLTPEGRLGFQAAGSNATVLIRECLQLVPALAGLWPRLEIAPEEVPQIERLGMRAGESGELVVLETAGQAPEVSLDLPASVVLLGPEGTVSVLAGSDHVVQVVRGRPFIVSAGCFFQVNTPAAELLVALVLEALSLRGGESVLDLYCGVGLFTAFIAPLAGQVTGVEAYSPAVDDAAANLDEFDNVALYAAPAEVALPALEMRFDAVVLDPPRAGCSPAVCEALLRISAPRLVYVSCDAATLARDARRLVEAGGYHLERVQPLDMFPQTHHVECVALFTHHR